MTYFNIKPFLVKDYFYFCSCPPLQSISRHGILLFRQNGHNDKTGVFYETVQAFSWENLYFDQRG